MKSFHAVWRVKRSFSVLLAAILFSVSPLLDNCRAAETTLTMATYIPVGYPVIDAAQRFFVDRVNETGGGTVQIDMYWGGTLLKGMEILPGLQAGTADIVFQTTAYLLGSFPILGVQILPIWPDIMAAHGKLKMGTPLAGLQNEVLRKKDLYQLAVGGVVPEFLFTKDKMVRHPADMKGLKIRAAGKVEGMVIQTLGAVPVMLPSADLPQALQRGVIDGALMNAWTARGRGLEDSCRYMLVFPLANQSTPIYTKRSKWEHLPGAVQKVLLNAAHDWEQNLVSLVGEKNDLEKVIIPSYEKAGLTVVYPDAEQKAAFHAALQPVIAWWIKEVGADVGEKAIEIAGEAR